MAAKSHTTSLSFETSQQAFGILTPNFMSLSSHTDHTTSIWSRATDWSKAIKSY